MATNQNELPDWAQVGATVYRLHESGYQWRVSRSAGKIVRRTATQIVAEFPSYRVQGETEQKRFKMSKSYRFPELVQIGEKYSDDKLISEAEGLAKIAAEDKAKAVLHTQAEIAQVGAKLNAHQTRWIGLKEIDETIDQLQELRRRLVELGAPVE